MSFPVPLSWTLLIASLSRRIKHRYTSRVMRGFAGSFSEETRAELEKNEAVKYIGTFGAWAWNGWGRS